MLIEISEPKNIFNLFCSNIHAMAMVDIIGPSLRSWKSLLKVKHCCSWITRRQDSSVFN